ncbi:alpha/beta fold hydrolase [Streptomyces sp. TRM43335]|uniref:Alpha/beta fold hydrolase n=1 Tax=Streptomyces taklimakanensis TaxID=2569853 RepID=A0A6G2BED6_9ACTN|nr:alpha/beta fold hydrolase [Streptomyces taklimakanensis]MTE20645.1 alpha/beta fold hydrolase [Streptomyces taklimakanensis]
MRVTRALPFASASSLGALPLSLIPLAPREVRAAALEAAFLAGRTLLYPAGMAQERYVPPPATDRDGGRRCPAGRPGGAGRDGTGGRGRHRRPPVLLLHGFVDNRSVFTLLRRSLVRNGWEDVCAFNYSPLTCDIRCAAERLAEHVEKVCESSDRRRIDVVGHSLGGLIARYYAQRMGGDARIRTLVTLGTPHTGTRVAPLMSAHPVVRQLRPGSEVLEELTGPAPGCRTRFVAFWSDLDQLMLPVESARLDHPDLDVRNVRVRGLGHLALLAHPEVAAGVRRELAAGARRHRATGGPGPAGRSAGAA